MGLTDALFAGTSGLRSLGHGMSVVGDNVANLNTSAFKGARITFSDVMAQRINTSSGSGQMGRGASINALYPTMQQGSFESTASPTDLAIAGNGFFILKEPGSSGNTFYTRDGQFLVEKQGYLVNPAGLRVQGWQIDEVSGDITGALTDIQIQRSSPPVATQKIDIITNLDAREELDNVQTLSISGDIQDNTPTTVQNISVGDINGNLLTFDVQLEYNSTNEQWLYTIDFHDANFVDISGATPKDKPSVVIENPITKEKIEINWSGVETGAASSSLTISNEKYKGLISLSPVTLQENQWSYFDITDVDGNGNDLRVYFWFDATNQTWDYYAYKNPSGTDPSNETGVLLSFAEDLPDNEASKIINFYFDNNATQRITVDWRNVGHSTTGSTGDISSSATAYDTPLRIQNLYDKWNARNESPLSSTDYVYRTTLSIYDALGTPHEVTIYYDRTTKDNVYEFLVTCDPNEDQRDFVIDDQLPFSSIKKGVLMYGRIEFDTQGNIKNDGFYEVYRVDPNTGNLVQMFNNKGEMVNPIDGGDTLGPHGYPLLLADFLGINLNEDYNTFADNQENSKNLQAIELNFGYYFKDGAWRPESVRSTQYATSHSTIYYDQDGYGPGYLESISVDTEGVLTGHYSNGRVIPLWMVGLANFNAPEMLDKAGGNLFRETTHSGPPVTGKPGTNGLGSIAPNSLEQSNVDLGEQFVKMITIQRGFQADARTITVTDAMLEELINLKR
ncbi:flagellar hook-basal body complex protein [Thermodesulfatator autotrophicus]|uniref:Flagellar hook protein FlgE n=1 Tax=Thermodesulfatator autotrophicus TaxID=1795632 RepID=A0A177E5G0_9BACT|nr:flagellar hook-basal body complex protein [Thermodesulfatator autotrophicus]OAG27135.1 hypothetical protein TH606_08475 [Thermodesulfatator autotrophicus]